MTDQDTYDRTVDEPAVAPESGLGHVPNEPYYQQPARRGGARVAGAVLLIIGLLWLFAQYSPGLSLPFGLGNGTLLDTSYNARQLVMDVNTGDIEVRTWNEPTIHVEATYRGGSAGDYAVMVEPRGDTLTIGGGAKPFVPLFGPRNVQYRITVPANADARIKTANGDIDVSGLGGQTNLESTSGDIEAADLARGVTVSTVNGDIALNGVASVIGVKSVNGDIAIEDGREATLTLVSTNSDIRYKGSLVAGASNTIDTVSGDVDLRLDENSSFDLQADTVSGDISTDYTLANKQEDRRSLRGKANGGGTSLKISTTSGDISVETR